MCEAFRDGEEVCVREGKVQESGWKSVSPFEIRTSEENKLQEKLSNVSMKRSFDTLWLENELKHLKI